MVNAIRLNSFFILSKGKVLKATQLQIRICLQIHTHLCHAKRVCVCECCDYYCRDRLPHTPTVTQNCYEVSVNGKWEDGCFYQNVVYLLLQWRICETKHPVADGAIINHCNARKICTRFPFAEKLKFFGGTMMQKQVYLSWLRNWICSKNSPSVLSRDLHFPSWSCSQ